MLKFLIDNIFVSFGGVLFQQVVDIPMGTNCAPLLVDLLVYSYESEFLQNLVKDKKIHEARPFNFTYRYIDDVLSINNPRFAECIPLIFPLEQEIKRPQIQFRPIHFRSYISNLTTVVMCSNIPASPAYDVYISQLIRFARASSNYSHFLKRHLYLRNSILDQGFKKICLIRYLKKFIFRYQDLVGKYSVSAETLINNGFSESKYGKCIKIRIR
jgi:hypothetical protein